MIPAMPSSITVHTFSGDKFESGDLPDEVAAAHFAYLDAALSQPEKHPDFGIVLPWHPECELTAAIVDKITLDDEERPGHIGKVHGEAAASEHREMIAAAEAPTEEPSIAEG